MTLGVEDEGHVCLSGTGLEKIDIRVPDWLRLGPKEQSEQALAAVHMYCSEMIGQQALIQLGEVGCFSLSPLRHFPGHCPRYRPVRLHLLLGYVGLQARPPA